MLVTLDEAKAYMGVEITADDVEILRLCSSATDVVQSHAGPTPFLGTYTETVAPGVALVRHRPLVSVQTADAEIVSSDAGTIRSYGGEVTYTAGLESVPDAYVDAALVFISYKYRRNRGGSESYMPAGADGGIAPPMGVSALEQQIRLALGPYARSSSQIA